MRWVKLFILFLILIYGFRNEQLYTGSVKQDFREEILERFFQKYNSPLANESAIFIEVADKYKLDWKILPVVGMVESTGCKKYRFNCFGWASDSVDYGNNAEDIAVIARKISVLSYYKTYKKTGLLRDFSVAYNAPFADTYEQKIRYFYNKLN